MEDKRAGTVEVTTSNARSTQIVRTQDRKSTWRSILSSFGYVSADAIGGCFVVAVKVVRFRLEATGIRHPLLEA